MSLASSAGDLSAFTVEHLSFMPGKLTVRIVVKEPFPRMTDDRLAAYALEAFPELGLHRCVNDAGPLFASAIECTPVPHLLEHLVISLQARDPQQPSGFALVGSTEWLNEAAGRARIAVSFKDDLIAARAMNRALRFLDEGMVRFYGYGSHHVRSDRR